MELWKKIQTLKAIEHKLEVSKSENNRLIYQVEINALKPDVSKGVEAYNFIQELKQIAAK